MTDQNDVAPGRWLAYTPPLLLLVLLVLSVQLFRRADAGRADVRKIERVRLLTLRSLSWLQDAETGQRGYLLTGSDDYLLPYRLGRDSVMVVLHELDSATKDEEEQQRYLRILIPLARQRVARLDSGVALRRRGTVEQVLEALPFAPGKVVMDSARTLFDRMWQVEGRVLIRREAREREDQRLLQYALVVGVILSALASLLVGNRLADNATRHWLMTAELNARIAMLRGRDGGRTSGETQRITPTSNETIT